MLLKIGGCNLEGVMNKLELWQKVNSYFLEGVITPIKGEYILKGEQKLSYRADLVGSMILVHVGPTKFSQKTLDNMPAIEPGGVAELIKIYSAREIALLECAYENAIFGWSREYLSTNDIEVIDDWIAKNRTFPNIRERFRYFVNNLMLFSGEVNLPGFQEGNS